MTPIKARVQAQPLTSKTWKLESKPHVQPMSLQDFLGESSQTLPGPWHPQKCDWALQFDSRAQRGQGPHPGGQCRDQRPHVELPILWSPVNVQCALPLVDTGAGCPVIYGNPEQFPGTPTVTNGHGDKGYQRKTSSNPIGNRTSTPKGVYCEYLSHHQIYFANRFPAGAMVAYHCR